MDSTKTPADSTAEGPATFFGIPVPPRKLKPTSGVPLSEAEMLSSPRTLDNSIRRFNSRLKLVASVVSNTSLRVRERGTALQVRGDGLQLNLLEGVVSDTVVRVRHHEQPLQAYDATEPLFEADNLDSEEEAEVFYESMTH